MKIIHTADLHLDSRLETNMDRTKAKNRRKELITAFENTVDFAVKNSVRLFIIAGDMFDSGRVTEDTVTTVSSIIAGAEGVDFLVLSGNHDSTNPFMLLSTLPKNLHFFSDNWQYYEYDNVTVGGINITEHNVNVVAGGPDFDKDRYNIAVMHGDIALDIRLTNLRLKNIDYLALGHLHEHSSGKFDERGTYAYSGCLESRGFDECGKKGFVLLDTDKRSFEFVSQYNLRTMYQIPVDISGLFNYAQIKDAVAKELSHYGAEEKDMVKIVLTGSYTLETVKDLPQLEAFLKNNFFFSKVKDNSTMQINIDEYRHDISLKGEFVRQVLSSDLADNEKDSIILCGIRLIRGEEAEV